MAVKTKKKLSESQLTRFIVRLYWEQQLQNKYPDFETYWHMVNEKIRQKFREKTL